MYRDPAVDASLTPARQYFAPILNFLRTGTLVLDEGVSPEGVLQEALFFGLHSVVELLNQRVESTGSREGFLTRSVPALPCLGFSFLLT